jgi:hypothetical protein
MESQPRKGSPPPLWLAVGLLALGTAGGFSLGTLIRQRRNEGRLAEYERQLAGYERRLAAFEKSGGRTLWNGTRPPRDLPSTEQLVAGMRQAHAEACRRDYRRLVEEVRKVTGSVGGEWKRAEAVLQRHFEPVEKALQEFLASPDRRAPGMQEIRGLVGPGVAGTLEDLRAALGEAAWARIDAWRRPDGASSSIWRKPRYGYFLLPQEYETAHVAAAGRLRWNLSAASLQVLFGRLGLPRHEEDELRAVLQDHFNRYSAAVGGLGTGARRPEDAAAKVRGVIELTEDKLRLVLNREKFKLYESWKASPSNFARRYFLPPEEPAKP